MPDISLGVASSKAQIDSGTITGVTQLKTATGSTVGFYGATPVSQRAGAAQASSLISVTSTAVNTSIVAWMLEVTATLVALGIWTGAA